jgi:hypothetical protein
MIMKSTMTGAAGLAASFFSGMLVATALGGDPGEEGGDVFSIGAEAVHDGRFEIVFADSAGACEGVAEELFDIRKINTLSYLLAPPGDKRKVRSKVPVPPTNT